MRPHSYGYGMVWESGTSQHKTAGTACTDGKFCCETICSLRSCLDGSSGSSIRDGADGST